MGSAYVSNAGSSSVTGIASSSGALAGLGNTSTDPGTVDATSIPGADYLYIQAGLNGTLDSFRVDPGGSLTPISALIVVDGAAGGEGTAAT